MSPLVLSSLHAIGWVHRDISLGNILLLDGTPPVVKLADLEYAKEVGPSPDGQHEMRTVRRSFVSF